MNPVEKTPLCVTIFFGMMVLLFASSCSSVPNRDDKNFLGNYPPLKLESMMLNTMSVKKSALTVLNVDSTFYPKINTVNMNFVLAENKTLLVLSYENRQSLIAAMNNYLEQYKSGKLTSEKNREKSYFGQDNIKTFWGVLSTAHYTKLAVRYEYAISNTNRPYFMIVSEMQSETDENGYDKENGTKSPALNIAISPLQCQKIISLYSQESLLKIVSDLDAKQAQFDIPVTSADSSDPAKSNEMF